MIVRILALLAEARRSLAQITVRNALTGAQVDIISRSTGNYSLAQCPSGDYDLKIEVTGLKRYAQQRITVGMAQTVRGDASLEAGSVTEPVVVTAKVPILKTESAEQSFNIDAKRINSLPLNFGARGPGSFRNSLTGVALLPGGNITDRNNIRINGTPNVMFGIRVEGQNQARPHEPGRWAHERQPLLCGETHGRSQSLAGAPVALLRADYGASESFFTGLCRRRAVARYAGQEWILQ